MGMERFEIRTDLALEVREDLTERGEEIKGIRVSEEERYDGEVKITTVSIETNAASKTMKKEKGKYLTIEAPFVTWEDEKEQELIAGVVADFIKTLLTKEERKSVLVVGLGKREEFDGNKMREAVSKSTFTSKSKIAFLAFI